MPARSYHKKFYCSNSKNSKTRSPKQIAKIQKIIEILIEKLWFFPTFTESFLTRFPQIGGSNYVATFYMKFFAVRKVSDIQKFRGL